LRAAATTSIAALADEKDGAAVTVGGIVAGVSRRYTRNGELMLIIQLEDLEGSVEVVCFPRTTAEHGHRVRPDAVLVDHCQRRVEPHLPKTERQVAWARFHVDRLRDAVEAFHAHVELMSTRLDALGGQRRGADELAIDEHLGTGHVGLDAQRAQLDSGLRGGLGSGSGGWPRGSTNRCRRRGRGCCFRTRQLRARRFGGRGSCGAGLRRARAGTDKEQHADQNCGADQRAGKGPAIHNPILRDPTIN